MRRLRDLVGRLRRSRRALAVLAVVVVLAAAALLDVPGRVSALAPPDAPPTARPSAPPAPTPDPGVLLPATDGRSAALDRCTPGSAVLAQCGPAPELGGRTWVGSAPVSLDDLRGSVIVVGFFSASCLSCRRDARYLSAWQDVYRDAGLQVVGVHSPRFDFEQDVDRLADTVRDVPITYPVLNDPSSATLAPYRSDVLPSTYLIDRDGVVRAIALGEGGHFRIEAQIRKLLAEDRQDMQLPPALGDLEDGEDAAPGTTTQIDLVESRGRRYDEESDTVTRDGARFRLPSTQPEGTFSFGGPWQISTRGAVPGPTGVARVSFRARTAYQLVSGTGSLVVTSSDAMVRRIRVDGGPDLHKIHVSDSTAQEVLTVRYEGDLRVYAFAFG